MRGRDVDHRDGGLGKVKVKGRRNLCEDINAIALYYG